MPGPTEERRKALLTECERLEDEAGLSEHMSKAREGRFMPLGIDGEDCTPDAYSADEFDSFREQARNAYFSVADLGMRCQLIRARRTLDRAISKSEDDDLVSLRVEEREAAARVAQQPWTGAAVLAGLCVAVGYWQHDLPGAIGGAVVGYFLGNGVISGARRSAESALAEVSSRVRFAEKDAAVSRLMPESFTKSEELTGERDRAQDRLSALARVLDHERGPQ